MVVKKTRCLLDQKRDFRDAFGFGGKEYDIYENQGARKTFLKKFKAEPHLQARVAMFLSMNNSEKNRKDYFEDKENEKSDDDPTRINRYDYEPKSNQKKFHFLPAGTSYQDEVETARHHKVMHHDY